MFTIISRIVHYGFKNFVRSGLLSTATVAIVTLSLVVFAGLIVANKAADSTVAFLEDKIDISVYFKTTAPEDEILRIKSSLEGLAEVKGVEYVSADKALEIFRERHANDDTILQSLNELNQNPLQPHLNIKASDPSKYASIATALQSPNLSDQIDTVSYAKNQTVIDRLISLIAGVNRLGLVITIFLTVVAGLVVFNTIRIVIYSNRDEINIMRLVGASNALVRGPYVVEGIFIGIISAVLSLLIIILAAFTVPLFYQGGTYFDLSIPGFSLKNYLFGSIGSLLIYQVLFGVLLTSVSSFFAVRRYLKA
jgi:cell division transport system permease protein